MADAETANMVISGVMICQPVCSDPYRLGASSGRGSHTGNFGGFSSAEPFHRRHEFGQLNPTLVFVRFGAAAFRLQPASRGHDVEAAFRLVEQGKEPEQIQLAALQFYLFRQQQILESGLPGQHGQEHFVGQLQRRIGRCVGITTVSRW